ncbi:MAG TPA: TIR domain-containing protein [Sphingomicrobium sp.]|jgi:tetratricopeptide (TPR) repeat protein
MAKLFLSYSRKDAAKAQRLCEWLEREGHSVWRDEDDIGGGASFSSEIEKALNDCEAVIVLWSADSVQSAWVRDEAGFGRDAGKLIPISLDGTGPPLGFRQFQSIDLSKWKGHGAPPVADKVGAAIARISGSPASPVPSVRGTAKAAALSRPMIAAAVVAFLTAVAVGSVLAWRSSSGGRAITIAVMASPASPNHAMAADYANIVAADMAAFLPRRFDRATVIAPADATGRESGYRMLVSTNPHGVGANASLTLSDQDGHTTLWSKNWSVADASAAELKQDVSASASKAALCLTDAKGGAKRLSQPALGLYLSGCAGIGDEELSGADFQSIFERLTKLEPGFPVGWAYLALSRSLIAEQQRDKSPATYTAVVQSARQAIERARELNPRSGLTYHAEYHLISDDHLRALQSLEKGASIDPDDGLIQGHLSEEFRSVGRNSDSVQAAQRAVELEPSSPYARSQYISALVYAGEFSKAKADIAEARKKWPNDPLIDFADYAFQYRYGDPHAALTLMPRIADYSDADMVPAREFIAARLERTPAKIDEAIAALNARWSNKARTRNLVLLALGNFGRVDEAYQLLADPEFQPAVDTDILFRPDFAGVRADPRFMQVAARLGLVRYWRKTGYWPDFCTSEQLKYDCKTEAAKYGS